MLSQDEFERNLKKDYGNFFAAKSEQPFNDLFNKPPIPQVVNAKAKSKREEMWEAKRMQREGRTAFPKDLIGVPSKFDRGLESVQMNQMVNDIPQKLVNKSFQAYSQADLNDVQDFNMKRQVVEEPSYKQLQVREESPSTKPTIPQELPALHKSSNIFQSRPTFISQPEDISQHKYTGERNQLFEPSVNQQYKPNLYSQQEFTYAQPSEPTPMHIAGYDMEDGRELVEQLPVTQSRVEPEYIQQGVIPKVNPEVERKRQYLEELKQQLELKEQRAKEERLRKIKQEREELQNYQAYNPFGKAGAGAPLRDRYGNIRVSRKPISQEQPQIEKQLPNPYSAPYNPSISKPEYHLTQEQYYKPQYVHNNVNPTSGSYLSHQGYPQPNVNAPQGQYMNNAETFPSVQNYPNVINEQKLPIVENTLVPPVNEYIQPVNRSIPIGREQSVGQVNEYASDFITKVYEPEKEVERKRKAMEMQKVLAQQMEERKLKQERERKEKQREERLEEEKIIRERRQMEEEYKKEQEERKRKVANVQAENLAILESKMKAQRKRNIVDSPKLQPTSNEPIPISAKDKAQIKNDLFGDNTIENKPFVFQDKESPIQPKGYKERVRVASRERGHSREGPKEHTESIRQSKLVNEITEKLKVNLDSEITDMKKKMEQQQKYLMDELVNLKMEAKRALDQKAIAQQELFQLKSELNSQKRLKHNRNELTKDYRQNIGEYKGEFMGDKQNYELNRFESRPESRPNRSLMSRGDSNKEMKNYERLFFDKLDTFNKQPQDNEGTSVDINGKLLKTESELIDIGCIDPNKSLYLGDSDSPFKEFSKNSAKIGEQPQFPKVEKPESSYGDELHYFNKIVERNLEEDSLEFKYKQSAINNLKKEKAVDTLDFLDKVANGPNHLNLEESKLRKGLDKSGIGQSLKESASTSILNSMKVNEINQINNKRLKELEEREVIAPKDEMDKLDDLLLNIIQNKTNAKDSLTSNAAYQIDLPSLKDQSFNI